jgi:hypothetical protein
MALCVNFTRFETGASEPANKKQFGTCWSICEETERFKANNGGSRFILFSSSYFPSAIFLQLFSFSKKFSARDP